MTFNQRTGLRAGSAVGEYVLDLDILEKGGVFQGLELKAPIAGVFSQVLTTLLPALQPCTANRSI